jgi:hypothetical protein
MLAIISIAFRTKTKLSFTKHADRLDVRMYEHNKMSKDMRMQLCLRSREKRSTLRDKDHHHCETIAN